MKWGIFICSAIIAISIRVKAQRQIMPNHKRLNDYIHPLPIEYINIEDLPKEFTWSNINGTSYITPPRNQHLPVYCGSCWAHAAMSSLADRIKIARMTAIATNTTNGPLFDIILSIQFILNCGGSIAGSCHGGSATGAFEFIKYGMGFVPYETCQPYIACSSDSTEYLCQCVSTECTPINICKTCGNPSNGGTCNEIDKFPYATISEYGFYRNASVNEIKAEIYTRGPVTAGIAGSHLHEYTGGIIRDNPSLRNLNLTHEVSIVGWGYESSIEYWIVRNSHGEYWGELSFFRIELGINLLGIETEVSWATPDFFTIHNVPCVDDGSNCRNDTNSMHYLDPSVSVSYGRRLLSNL